MSREKTEVQRATYTVEEAAQILGIGRGLAYKLVHSGELPALRLGEKRYVVPRVAVERILNGEGAGAVEREAASDG